MFQRYGLLFSILLVCCPSASAQNVTGYDIMPDPILFLLREPAVQEDLELSESQLSQLIQLNESLDALMLGARANKSMEEAQDMTSEVMETSRTAIAELFTKDQQIRMQQIKLHLKGISSVLLPEIAKAMELTKGQQETILKATIDANEKIKKVSSSEFPGEEAHAKSQRVMIAARKEEQETIFELLDASQKRKLTELVGEPFDSKLLGRVAFKTPKLIDSGEWINTDGLEIADLRGKVVALHFFAYG